MRNNKEILTRLKHLEEVDLFGWQISLLLGYLPFELALPILQRRTLSYSDGWKPLDRSQEVVIRHMGEFMPLALQVARNHRGTKADRAISYMKVWLWLLDEATLLAFAEDGNHYPQFGVPILQAICSHYHFPFPHEDTSLSRMARSEVCNPQGCPFNTCLDEDEKRQTHRLLQ